VGAPSDASTRLFRDAARAIHGQRDRHRLVAWVAHALDRTAAVSVTGLALHSDTGSPLWVTASGPNEPLSALGDPRTFPELAAALAGETRLIPRGSHLHDLLDVAELRLTPVPRGDGGAHGVALVGWRANEQPPAGAMQQVAALAAHLGIALDNQQALAEIEAVQRGVVHRLQEAVRPPTPAVAQTELGVYYLAAGEQASTGGDLYDWVLLPDGDLHVAVVDVMGKGVSATKDAVAVTHALRLLVLDGCPLDRVITRADALVTAQNPDLVATLIIGRYDPATGRLRLVGGGHPPALLISQGQVHRIETGGMPIGFPGAGSEGETVLHLDRNDTVVLYTDGLIETTKDIVKGLDALTRFAEETASYPAASLARALVDRALEGAIRDDDSLALVLRRRSPPLTESRLPLAPLEYRFTPTTAAVPLARHFLEDWLARVPVEASEAGDLSLVATELCANAVRYASGQRGSVALRARVDGSDVILEVEDDGGAALPVPDFSDDHPDPLAERGRGLFLVQALVDELKSDLSEGRTTIQAIRRSAVAGAATKG
jgi:serine phosphatase RsbU (regulator of sigma subunit)/anti-sigma regulatory factor (Ser/Thr protein kinase)